MFLLAERYVVYIAVLDLDGSVFILSGKHMGSEKMPYWSGLALLAYFRVSQRFVARVLSCIWCMMVHSASHTSWSATRASGSSVASLR